MTTNMSKVTPQSRTVSFLMPNLGTVPIGGYKIVYEYANRLCERGWQVRVVHPCTLTHEEIQDVQASSYRRARYWLRYQRRILTGDYRPDQWFKVNPKVDLICTKSPELRYMPPSDIWIATWWYTAKWVVDYPGAGFYFIQHLETFGGPEQEVMDTWKLPLRKIVSSRWLADVATQLGETAEYITYGLDFKHFGMDVMPERRDPYTVGMLYHESDWKGSADGLKALEMVKATVPALKAVLYGTPAPPQTLPSWIEYHQKPAQAFLRELYNRTAIFLGPSWSEGWGLPPAEALQCGAALAITDNGGHREFARPEETALLSPPRCPEALAANLLRLVEDQELRIRLAYQGNQHIQQFTWDRAVTHFESALSNCFAPTGSQGENAGVDLRSNKCLS